MSLYFETSWGSLNKTGEELCGDKVEIVKTPEKDTIMVLSDGLGSGVKANILASLTSKIIATMLSEGADLSDVVETIASTLPVCKERLVAYSTFVMLRVTPEGDARIVEFDNPDMVIIRNGKALPLEWQTSVIADKQIKEAKLKLRPGDFCVTFSDGVIHAGVGKLLNLGWQWNNVVEYLENSYRKEATAHAVQSLLLAACNNLYMESPGDDTTVAVLKVRTPNPAFVMVGPPVDKENDEKLVHELMTFEGTKIVCGGTTSQIVSRLTGRPVKTLINYISPDVPPIGEIDGIDLVTEGVITLGKTLEIMQKYENQTVGRENALNYKSDGAHLLAQTLISKCTSVKFVVGRALNPAHQNPELPFDLAIKLRLVKDIADCLRRLDKEVEVLYY